MMIVGNNRTEFYRDGTTYYRLEVIHEVNDGARYIEVFYASYVEHSYLEDSDILESVTTERVTETDKLFSGEPFNTNQKIFRHAHIPEVMKVVIARQNNE